MNADMLARWDEVMRVVDLALDSDPPDRPAVVERLCSGDAVLRGEVDRLMDAAARAADFLSQPAATDAAPLVLWVARQEAQRLAVGTRFGAYEVRGLLGRGGMATVYLAQDHKHHRRVAVKVLHAEVAAAVRREWFLREIDTAAGLHHPHILPLHDSGDVDGRLYYVMPHVEGESLRQRLSREGRIPLASARRIAQEVAGALDYAHRQGVVHRDIKPENILLQDGQAVVADFGIAGAIATGAVKAGTVSTIPPIGTPAYMSPEQVRGETVIDGRADVYALACVLYEMIAGQPLFTGTSVQQILARHSAEPLPPLHALTDSVPPSVERAVTRALAKEPGGRFSTAREFADALGTEVAGDAPATSTPAVNAKGWPRRLVAPGAIAIVVTGLAVAVTREPTGLNAGRVLVTPFENLTGDPNLNSLGDLIANDLIRGLAATANVEEALDARSQTPSGGSLRLDAAGAGAAARAARAGYAVWGTYNRATRESLRVEAQVVDTRTGRAERAIGPMNIATPQGGPELEEVRTRVMAGVASLLDPDLQGTSVPATYQAYVEWAGAAAAVNSCTGDWTSCRAQRLAHLQRAAAIDSDFTLPETSAALIYSHAGDCRSVDSVVVVLGPRLVRLPAVDRAQLQAATLVCRGDRLAALVQARSGLHESPSSRPLAVVVASLALQLNQPRLAIHTLERFRPSGAVDLYEYFSVLLGAYHRAGLYDRALRRVAEERKLASYDGQVTLQTLFASQEIVSLAALGRLSDLTRALDEAVGQFDAERRRSSVVGMMELAGLELAAHGQAGAAKVVGDRAIAWIRRQPDEQQATPEMRLLLASVLNDEGRWDEAYPVYRSLVAEDSNHVEGRLMLGDIASRRGDRREAEQAIRWLAAHTSRGPGTSSDWTLHFLRLGRIGPAQQQIGEAQRVKAWRTAQVDGPPDAMSESWALYLQAQIAGLLGDRERALRLLQEATRKGFSRWGAAHVDPDLGPLRGDPDFQEWIRPKD